MGPKVKTDHMDKVVPKPINADSILQCGVNNNFPAFAQHFVVEAKEEFGFLANGLEGAIYRVPDVTSDDYMPAEAAEERPEQ